jgi:hypothetical protein
MLTTPSKATPEQGGIVVRLAVSPKNRSSKAAVTLVSNFAEC